MHKETYQFIVSQNATFEITYSKIFSLFVIY